MEENQGNEGKQKDTNQPNQKEKQKKCEPLYIIYSTILSDIFW
jgi:hypothetical protein